MNRPRYTTCGGHGFTRRHFLFGAAGASLLSVHADAEVATSGATPRNTAKACIFVNLNGGASQLDTFDVKDAPWNPADADIRQYGDLALSRKFFPKLSTMTSDLLVLRGWAHACAQSAAGSCTDTFAAKVSPELPTLLFMSESDRPLDLVTFKGAGAAAPTPEQLMVLVGAQAGSTAYTRPAANFIQALEYAPNTTGYGINNVNEAFRTQLVDVTYIVIEKPSGDPYHAEVDVYLVGRTLCGDLVGIHAISIETRVTDRPATPRAATACCRRSRRWSGRRWR